MNRIITILVTIFILLLLYIWISHVWGSDHPRRPNEIIDARQNEMSDGLMADADTSLHSNVTETPSQEPVTTNDEFSTERKTEATSSTDNSTADHEPAAAEPKKPAPKPEIIKSAESPKKETKNTPSGKTTTNTAAGKTNASTAKPTATSTKATPAPVSNMSGTGGKHLVIAGNFSQLANAQQRVDELKKAGFKDTEIINFDLSEYHTVCVGRFADVNEARKLVKKLKDYHKIDAYVRIGG
jgi:cell division septation protein DedD